MAQGLSGWQSIAALLIAATLAVVGALVPNAMASGAMMGLAGSVITGVFALMQPRRDPNSRGRSSDRIPTSAQGVPVTPPPELLPPPGRREGPGR